MSTSFSFVIKVAVVTRLLISLVFTSYVLSANSLNVFVLINTLNKLDPITVGYLNLNAFKYKTLLEWMSFFGSLVPFNAS
jgi:hypothetical protein